MAALLFRLTLRLENRPLPVLTVPVPAGSLALHCVDAVLLVQPACQEWAFSPFLGFAVRANAAISDLTPVVTHAGCKRTVITEKAMHE